MGNKTARYQIHALRGMTHLLNVGGQLGDRS